MPDLIQQAAQHLRTAKRIAVLTGAGISAESGIPTFRDAMTGFWAKFYPADLATTEAFARDPERAVAVCDFFISIGTSSEVCPAAGLIGQAIHAGINVLEVNPATTPFSSGATWSVRGKSGEVLPLVMKAALCSPASALSHQHLVP